MVYRAHVADKGWLDWVSNGEMAGTTGEARRVEAIEVKLVEKSQSPRIELWCGAGFACGRAGATPFTDELFR